VTEASVLPLHVADVTLPSAEHWPEGKPFPIVAHAVPHRDGVFLFDTGIGTGNAEVDELFSPERRPLEEMLAAHGIAMADVTAVANCHLHFDHSGQNGLFPGRTIFAQRAEWAMVHEPDYTVPEWIDVPGLSYELLEGETEVGPGLRLVPTTGHSPGHQSLQVETAEGTVVIAGQAVLTKAEWLGSADPLESGVPKPEDESRQAYEDSVGRLRALDPVRVHFVHDPEIWTRTD
jgi:glyoxylase-like metal-dependent hydrolase (beta-lactamase superfamily II)